MNFSPTSATNKVHGCCTDKIIMVIPVHTYTYPKQLYCTYETMNMNVCSFIELNRQRINSTEIGIRYQFVYFKIKG